MQTNHIRIVALKWAHNQIELLKINAKGDGYNAIEARHKLNFIKTLNQHEYEEAAVLAFLQSKKIKR